MARRARGRAVARRLLSPRVHVAGPDRRYRLSEKIRDLRSLLQSGCRDQTHDRRRSQTSWRQDRYHRRAAHLGFGAHSPSASAHDRARRRHCARPTALGVVPASFLPPGARLSRLFRRRLLKMLAAAREAGRLNFFGDHAARADTKAFTAFLAPLHKVEWVVYAKRPFGGPEAVLAYLARYTHRVAISNRRLISCDDRDVTFKWKDYRIEGPARYKLMTLPTHEFIRRFLMHVLPKGLHRVRHYGLFASADRAANIERARQLLAAPSRSKDSETPNAPATNEQHILPRPCPCCGGRMIIIETFERGCEPKYRPTPSPVTIRIDTS